MFGSSKKNSVKSKNNNDQQPSPALIVDESNQSKDLAGITKSPKNSINGADKEFPMKGVTDKCLKKIQSFIKDDGNQYLKWTTGEFCQRIILPLTSREQCSFVDLLYRYCSSTNNENIDRDNYNALKRLAEKTGEPLCVNFVSKLNFSYADCVSEKASVYVTHAWKYNLADFMDALLTIDERTERESGSSPVTYWIDIFVRNQWNLPAVRFDWLCGTLQNAISEIGHTCAIILPPEQPLLFHRAWCLWELRCTRVTKAKFSLQTTTAGRESLEDYIKSFESIQKFLLQYCDIDIESSLASNLQDKLKIFDAITRLAGGFIGVGSQISFLLKEWFIREQNKFVANDESKRIEIMITPSNANELATNALGDFAIENVNTITLPSVSKELTQTIAKATDSVAIKKPRDTEEALQEYVRLGRLYYEQGQLEEAEEMFRRALLGRQQTLGDNHAITVLTVNNLAALLHNRSKFDEAEEMYRRALEGSEKVLGVDHADTLSTVNNLGKLLQSKGQFAEAETVYRRALAGREKVLGKEDLKTLATVNNLGKVLQILGQDKEADELFRRAITGRRKLLGSMHFETLDSIHNYAMLLQKQGRVAEAEQLHRTVLAGRERVLGVDHRDTLESAANLGLLLQERNNISEAETFLRLALVGRMAKLGESHEKTIESRQDLAHLLEVKADREQKMKEAPIPNPVVAKAPQPVEVSVDKEIKKDTAVSEVPTMGDSEKAGVIANTEDNAKTSQEFYRNLYSNTEPDPSDPVLDNQSDMEAPSKQIPTDSEENYRKSLKIAEQHHGKDHLKSLQVAYDLAVVLDRKSQLEEAEVLYRRVLSGRIAKLGLDQKPTLQATLSLFKLLNKQELLEKDQVARCKYFLSAFSSNDDAELLLPAPTDLNNILEVLTVRKEKLSTIEELYRSALKEQLDLLGPTHTEVLQIQHNLGSLLHCKGNAAEAHELFAQTLRTRELVLQSNHPDTLTTLFSIGLVFKSQQKYEAAIENLQKCLIGREKVFGENHLLTIETLRESSNAMIAKKSFKDARSPLFEVFNRWQSSFGLMNRFTAQALLDYCEYLAQFGTHVTCMDLEERKALQSECEKLLESQLIPTLRKLYGEMHVDYISATNLLATIKFQNGQYDVAEEMYKQIVAGKEVQYGLNHVETLQSRGNLAESLKLQSKFQEAEVAYRLLFASSDPNQPHQSIPHISRRPDYSCTASYAELLLSLGHLSEAEALYRNVLNSMLEVFGSNYKETLRIMLKLAHLLQMRGNFIESEYIYQECLESSIQLFGGDHPDTLDIFCKLGNLLKLNFHYVEAVNVYTEALQICEFANGKNHPMTLKILHQYASLIVTMMKSNPAEDLNLLDNEKHNIFENLVSNCESRWGKEHPDTLAAYQICSEYLECMNLPDGSESLNMESILHALVVGQTAMYGEGHPDTLRSLQSYGCTLQALGKYDLAEDALKRCLAGKITLYGEQHVETSETMCHLGALFALTKRYELADDMYRKSLQSHEMKYGPSHMETLEAIQRLAWLQMSRGNYYESEKLYRRYRDELLSLYGPNDSQVMDAELKLSKALTHLSQFDEAEKMCRRILKSFEDNLIPAANEKDSLSVALQLAQVLHEKWKCSESIPLFKSLFVGFESTFGKDSSDYLTLSDCCAKALEDVGKYSDAETLFRASYSFRMDSNDFGKDHVATIKTSNAIARVLHAQGNLSESFKMYLTLVDHRNSQILQPIEGSIDSDILEVCDFRGDILYHINSLEFTESMTLSGSKAGSSEVDNEVHLERYSAVTNLKKALYGDCHPETIDQSRRLANMLIHHGRPHDAVNLLREALRCSQQTYGLTGLTTIEVKLALGKCLSKIIPTQTDVESSPLSSSNLAKVDQIMIEASTEMKKVLGEDHVMTLQSGIVKAEFDIYRQRYNEAAESLTTICTKLADSVGEHHHKYVDGTRLLLAAIIHAKDVSKLYEVEPLFRNYLQYCEKSYGAEHPWTVKSLLILSELLTATGAEKSMIEARELLRKVHYVKKRDLGRYHLDTMTVGKSIALLSFKMNKKNIEVLDVLRDGLKNSESELGLNHEVTLSYVEEIAKLAMAKWQPSKEMQETSEKGIEEMFRRVLLSRELSLGQYHCSSLASAHNLAAWQLIEVESFIQKDSEKISTLNDAIQLLRRTVKGREYYFGLNNLDTLDSMSLLLRALRLYSGHSQIVPPLAKAAYKKLNPIFVSCSPKAFQQKDSCEWKVVLDDTKESFGKVLSSSTVLFGGKNQQTISLIMDQADYYYNHELYIEAHELLSKSSAMIESSIETDENELVRFQLKLANCSMRLEKYSEAEQLYRKAFKGYCKMYSSDHPDTLYILHQLGSVLLNLGKLNDSEEMFRRALSGREKLLGEFHDDTIGTMRALGFVLQKKFKYQKAEDMFRQVLQRTESFYGKESPNHDSILTAMDDLAWLLLFESRASGLDSNHILYSFNVAQDTDVSDESNQFSTTKAAEATELFRKILEKNEKINSVDHPDTVRSVFQLANALVNHRQWKEADSYFRRALESFSQSLGADHPDTLLVGYELALCNQSSENLMEAKDLLRANLSGREKALGPNHPATLDTIFQLGFVLLRLNELEESESLLKRAISGREVALGKDRTDTILALQVTALTLERRGKQLEAEQIYRRAMASSERELGVDHLQTIHIVEKLAMLLLRQYRKSSKNDYAVEAEELYSRALTCKQSKYGKSSIKCLLTQTVLAEVQLARKSYPQAETNAKEAVQGLSLLVPEISPQLIRSKITLAYILHRANKFSEAETYYVSVLAVMQSQVESICTVGSDFPMEEQASNSLDPFKDSLVDLSSANDLHTDEVLNLMDAYGQLLSAMNRLNEAKALLLKCKNGKRKLYGDSHFNYLHTNTILGEVFEKLGDFNNAENYFRQSLSGLESVFGSGHLESLNAMSRLGKVLISKGVQLDEAEDLFRLCLSGKEMLFGADHRDVVKDLLVLANLLQSKGKLSEAKQHHRRAVNTLSKTVLARNNAALSSKVAAIEADLVMLPESRDAADYQNTLYFAKQSLAKVLEYLGETEEATDIMTEIWGTVSHELFEGKPEGSTLTICWDVFRSLSSLFLKRGRYAEAEGYHREVLEKLEQLNLSNAPETHNDDTYLDNVTSVDNGLVVASVNTVSTSSVRTNKAVGVMNVQRLEVMQELAQILYTSGKIRESEGFYRKLLIEREKTFGKLSSGTIPIVSSLALVLHTTGKLSAAESMYRRAVDGNIGFYGIASRETAVVAAAYSTYLQAFGRYAQAAELLHPTMQGFEQKYGHNHPDTIHLLRQLGHCHNMMGRFDDSVQMYKAALEGCVCLYGDKHFDVIELRNRLSSVLRKSGKLIECKSLCEASVNSLTELLGDDHPTTLKYLSEYGDVLVTLGKLEEAEEMFQRVAIGNDVMYGSDHAETLKGLLHLAKLKQTQGKFDESVELYQKVLQSRDKVLKRSLVEKKGGTDGSHPVHEVYLSDTLECIRQLATLLQMNGKLDESEALWRKVVAMTSLKPTKGTTPVSPKASSINSNSSSTQLDSIDTCDAMWNLAKILFVLGKYDECQQLYQRVITSRERQIGENHPDTLKCMESLVELFQIERRFDEAVDLTRKLLSRSESFRDRSHPDLLGYSVNLSAFLHNAGRFAEEKDVLLQLVKSFTAIHGEFHSITLESVNQLGNVYQALGMLEEAEAMYHKAVTGKDARSASNDDNSHLTHHQSDTQANTVVLAQVLQSKGLLDKGEELYRRALAGREKVLGLEHSLTLSTVVSLAELLELKGKHNLAEGLYRRALTGQIIVLGELNKETLYSIYRLGALHSIQGKYIDSEKNLRRSFEGCRIVMGSSHAQTLECCFSLGKLLLRQGNWMEAEDLFLNTFTHREATLGFSHRDTVIAAKELMKLWGSISKYSEAIALSRRYLSTSLLEWGPKHLITAKHHFDCASLLHSSGHLSDAKDFFQRAVSCLQDVLGDNHPDTIQTHLCLVKVQKTLGEWFEAEAKYNHVLDITTKLYGEYHLDAQVIQDGMAHLYQVLGKFDLAKSILQSAIGHRAKMLGVNHPDYLTSMENYFNLLVLMGDADSAIQVYETTLSKALKKIYGSDHPVYLRLQLSYASLLQTKGNLKEVEIIYLEVLDKQEKLFGSIHSETTMTSRKLMNILSIQGKHDQVLKLGVRYAQTAYAIEGGMVGSGDDVELTTMDDADGVSSIQEADHAIVEEDVPMGKEVDAHDKTVSTTTTNNASSSTEDTNGFSNEGKRVDPAPSSNGSKLLPLDMDRGRDGHGFDKRGGVMKSSAEEFYPRPSIAMENSIQSQSIAMLSLLRAIDVMHGTESIAL